MSVSNPFIFYSGTTAYDLRYVSSAWPLIEDTTKLDVRFVDEPDKFVRFDRVAFEAAWQKAFDAKLNKSLT